MSLVHSNKIASLELGRLIAMFAIIFLHSQSLNQLSRFAVPFFFLLSGFLIQPKLSRDPFTTLKNYSLPLIQVWLVWSVICLLMPFNWHAFLTNGYIAERIGY
jgi:surface polysaccharide O-acyltransferase-like enzyme